MIGDSIDPNPNPTTFKQDLQGNEENCTGLNLWENSSERGKGSGALKILKKNIQILKISNETNIVVCSKVGSSGQDLKSILQGGLNRRAGQGYKLSHTLESSLGLGEVKGAQGGDSGGCGSRAFREALYSSFKDRYNETNEFLESRGQEVKVKQVDRNLNIKNDLVKQNCMLKTINEPIAFRKASGEKETLDRFYTTNFPGKKTLGGRGLCMSNEGLHSVEINESKTLTNGPRVTRTCDNFIQSAAVARTKEDSKSRKDEKIKNSIQRIKDTIDKDFSPKKEK
jgi:hypothetical protein